MKTKIYLDTSVPSAFFDTSKPMRQLITQKWFENEAVSYEIYISALTIQEIERLRNPEKLINIRKLLANGNVTMLDITDEAIALGEEYIRGGAIPASEPEDAYHIAIATVHGIETLASWNFKHIVSINPIRKIHEINLKRGYQIVEIGSLELFGGSIYGNL
ncbi:MAG: type II toxin-antitoxin system VapC family toxin [Desulfuromonadaceae bacterium]